MPPQLSYFHQNSYDKNIVSNLDMEFGWHQQIITCAQISNFWKQVERVWMPNSLHIL
jgi:hypothetical protein